MNFYFAPLLVSNTVDFVPTVDLWILLLRRTTFNVHNLQSWIFWLLQHTVGLFGFSERVQACQWRACLFRRCGGREREHSTNTCQVTRLVTWGSHVTCPNMLMGHVYMVFEHVLDQHAMCMAACCQACSLGNMLPCTWHVVCPHMRHGILLLPAQLHLQ